MQGQFRYFLASLGAHKKQVTLTFKTSLGVGGFLKAQSLISFHLRLTKLSINSTQSQDVINENLYLRLQGQISPICLP